MTDTHLTRRRLLAGGALAGATAAAGCAGLFGGSGGGDRVETATVEDDRARTLAAAHAPDLYFGVGERWFPTDPRVYAAESGDQTTLDGFAAFDGYSRDVAAAGEPPHRVAFYRVVEYADTDLAVVQYWFYSAFDQFTTNFHWHDWELLQVFLDTSEETGDPETGDPQLLSASAHARSVPNNEFLDPETDRASVISEVGSHSSALGVNETKDVFERLPIATDIADVSNGALALTDLPAAYGLPRGEGYRLPFAMPELDGAPIYEHPDLPNVDRDHLVPAEMTVESFAGLPSPPDDLPLRETGHRFAFEGAETAAEADYTYELVPMAEMDVAEFTGPQLSFEFAVPDFAEDAIASHITTTGTPKTQPRYRDPVADVTDPRHRAALSERFGLDVTGVAGDVVALLREATSSDEAPGSNGVETTEPRVEGVALLESDPVAVPSFNGVVALRDVPPGDHRLTVNGAGVAPYSQPLRHEADGEATAAGVDGAVVVAANEDAVKVRASVDADTPAIARVRVDDDVAGTVYDAPAPPVSGGDAGSDGSGGSSRPGEVALYAHRDGAYTAEVEDAEGGVGAFRVNPGTDQSTATLADVRTGKASLTAFLLTLLTETTAQAAVFEDGDADGIDEVDVPDSTRERAGDAAETVADLLGETTETTETTEESVEEAVDDATNTTEEPIDDTTDAVEEAVDDTTDTTTTATDDAVSDTTDTTDDVVDATATPRPTPTATPEPTDTPTGRTGSDDADDVLDDLDRQPDAFTGLVTALDAGTRAAVRANDAAQAGDFETADDRLRGLRRRTVAIADAIERTRGDLPEQLPGLVERRLPQVERRIEQALASDR
ncbi:hypothetical protein [Halobaculum lipolyticum]|uniref:Uncharacterized protein n=1 Tax=Halobaculum lipolyticum TaxID=3032001 RepID=A0ABD5WBR1_9EURY|nr:hypothetical protein [Halobaculum sp. DT31]